MEISKEFLESEIAAMQSELEKAQTFLIQAQAVINAYRMLINKIEEKE